MLLKEKEKKPKLKLSNYIEGLPFQTRLEVAEATRSRVEQKNLNKSKKVDLYLNPVEFTKLITNFDGDQVRNMKIHKEKKQENDTFLSKYKISKKKLEVKNSAFENVFDELIRKYKVKGYHNVQNENNKLFEVSPLLIENNRIFDLFKLGDNYDIYEKDLTYASKLTNIVNEKIVLESRNLFATQEVVKPKVEVVKKKNFQKFSKADLILQIKKNEESIKNTSMIIDKKELKQMFESKDKPLSISLHKEIKGIKLDDKKLITKSILTMRNTFNETHQLSPKKRKNSPMADSKKNLNVDENLFQIVEFPLLEEKNKTSIRDEMRKITNKSVYSFKKGYAFKDSPRMKKNNNKEYFNSFFAFTDEEKKKMKEEKEKMKEEKKKMKEEIESRINFKRSFELDRIHEKINNKDVDNQEIIDYLVNHTGKDKGILEKGLKKKLGPNDIMTYIADLKTKVFSLDVNESYRNFTTKNGNFDINLDNLNKIRFFFY